jgi:hypothetical protein
MNDELGEVKAKIEATKAHLTEAERERKVDLVLMYGNLLVRLYDERARVEARLSAGEIYYNRGVCDILWFLPPPHVHDIILLAILFSFFSYVFLLFNCNSVGIAETLGRGTHDIYLALHSLLYPTWLGLCFSVGSEEHNPLLGKSKRQ